jgi:hypothetical protein
MVLEVKSYVATAVVSLLVPCASYFKQFMFPFFMSLDLRINQFILHKLPARLCRA